MTQDLESRYLTFAGYLNDKPRLGGRCKLVRVLGELEAVALRNAAQFFAEHGDTLLPAGIVGSFCAVLGFDRQAVVRSVDTPHLRIFAFTDAGILRRAEYRSTSPSSYRSAQVRSAAKSWRGSRVRIPAGSPDAK